MCILIVIHLKHFLKRIQHRCQYHLIIQELDPSQICLRQQNIYQDMFDISTRTLLFEF